jgi:urea transport system substrate-binding protein
VVWSSPYVVKPNPWSQQLNTTLGLACDWSNSSRGSQYQFPAVRVGILHSVTGTTSAADGGLLDAMMLAVDTVNRGGGLLGYTLLPIIIDGMNDESLFINGASTLASADDVVVILGGPRSISMRNALVSSLELHNKLLLYPYMDYGEHCSKSLIYGGSLPSQHIIPSIDWLLRSRSHHFYLISSNDNGYSSNTMSLARAMLRIKGGVIAGDIIINTTSTISSVVTLLTSTSLLKLPYGGIILSTVTGSTHNAVFGALTAFNMTSSSNAWTIMVTSLDEKQSSLLTSTAPSGTLVATSYLSNLDTVASEAYVDELTLSYGDHTTVTNDMESMSALFGIWLQGVEQVHTFETSIVRSSMYEKSQSSASGTVSLGVNHHVNKLLYIAQINSSTNTTSISSTTRQQWLPVMSLVPSLPRVYSDWGNQTAGLTCDWTSTTVLDPSAIEVPIHRVAILHSFSGVLEQSERVVADITLLAIQQLNDAGSFHTLHRLQSI